MGEPLIKYMIQIKLIKAAFLAMFILNVGCQLVLLRQDIFNGSGLTNCVYIVHQGCGSKKNCGSDIIVIENNYRELKSQKDNVMFRELLNETLTQCGNKFKSIETEIPVNK